MIRAHRLLAKKLATSRNAVVIRAFSSDFNKAHLAKWQRGCWETFLSTGRGSDNLFRSIDTNHSDTITVPELHVFLDSVGHKGVHPRAFKILDELAHDHNLTRQEFKSWLILATNFHLEQESQYSLGYERHPHVGERRPQPDDADFHSWNEHTMSQAVRKMQYAVRGQGTSSHLVMISGPKIHLNLLLCSMKLLCALMNCKVKERKSCTPILEILKQSVNRR